MFLVKRREEEGNEDGWGRQRNIKQRPQAGQLVLEQWVRRSPPIVSQAPPCLLPSAVDDAVSPQASATRRRPHLRGTAESQVSGLRARGSQPSPLDEQFASSPKIRHAGQLMRG